MTMNIRAKFKIMLLLIAVPLFGCDDGMLPLSEYENVDVNVYFYFPNEKEVYLGTTRGASSCGRISHLYAQRENLKRSDKWSYICCTIRKGSQCYDKIR